MYQYQQIATPILAIMGGLLSFTALAWWAIGYDHALAAFTAILLLVTVLFHRLQLAFDGKEVRFSFTLGLGRQRIGLDEIEQVTLVHNDWYHGLGIRITHDGWVYSAGGAKAVSIHLTNGSQYRVSCKEADAFIAAVAPYLPKADIQKNDTGADGTVADESVTK